MSRTPVYHSDREIIQETQKSNACGSKPGHPAETLWIDTNRFLRLFGMSTELPRLTGVPCQTGGSLDHPMVTSRFGTRPLPPQVGSAPTTPWNRWVIPIRQLECSSFKGRSLMGLPPVSTELGSLPISRPSRPRMSFHRRRERV